VTQNRVFGFHLPAGGRLTLLKEAEVRLGPNRLLDDSHRSWFSFRHPGRRWLTVTQRLINRHEEDAADAEPRVE
jgi:hypothetical protein